MRLLQRPPETPSLETWLSRDVPHETELKQELLARLGRERAVAALLQILDRERTKKEKWERTFRNVVLLCFCAYAASFILWTGFHKTPQIAVSVAQGLATLAIFAALFHQYRFSKQQKNAVTALFEYGDDPNIADALCLALPYYHSGQAHGPWALLEHVQRILPLLPTDKNTLSKEARANLRSRLEPIESGATADITPEQEADRTFYADFQSAVLHYFARTQDKSALRAIRKLAQAKTYSADGVRVRDAAQSALHSLLRSEP